VSRSDETETAVNEDVLSEEGPARRGLSKPALALLVLAVVVTLDLATKWWIVNNMSYHETIPVIGDVVRLTYTHNPGAAFGINIGEHSRIFFLVLSIVALGVLAAIYRSTPATDRLRLLAVALVGSGAIGNIVDRLRYESAFSPRSTDQLPRPTVSGFSRWRSSGRERSGTSSIACATSRAWSTSWTWASGAIAGGCSTWPTPP
jgi:lipoprotein signal peptidase